jgi:hypothetical protein
LKLEELRAWVVERQKASGLDESEKAHLFYAAGQIVQFQKDPKRLDLTPPAEPPDGPPIGTDEDFAGWN